MSAVVGLCRLDGRPVERTEMERMVECLAHRGPDGSGVWSEKAVGLGHRMLWTTPESLHEKLPLVGTAGEQVLTADARIDNRDDLIAELGVTAGPSGQTSDSELILRAYEHWGERCPEKLVGDFAFAIWDRRAQKLFCARDHFGVKPFYYHRSDRLFTFATEIKALLCLPEVPRRLNEVRVAEYLDSTLFLEDKTGTFYRDIMRLPPAHCLTIDRGTVRLRAYWALDPARELQLGSDEAYVEAFRAIFTEAVRCRLRSAYPVGSMLSGGLDSSSIVCTARHLIEEQGRPRLHTFSAVFDDLPQCDERPYIHAVLAKGGVDPHFVRGDQLSPLADLDQVLRCEDEPFHAPNLFLHWALYRTASEQRIRVLLDGLDGDLTVSHGIGYLNELARSGRWKTLAVEIRGLAQRFERSPRGIFFRHVLKPLVPGLVRRTWRAIRGWASPAGRGGALIHPEFATRMGLPDRLRRLRESPLGPLRSERAYHHVGLTGGVIPFALEVADKAAASAAIEPRYPFFDKRVAEFCLALPAGQKLHHGWTRMIMRRAMSGVLPVEVQWRGGKADLSPNFVHGLLSANRRLLEEEEMIGTDGAGLARYVRLETLQSTYRRLIEGRSERDALEVWKAVTLGLWLRGAELNLGVCHEEE